MTVLRSLLFVPGNKANMLSKAMGANADALIPDMEDSVPQAEKANARATVQSFLPKLSTLDRPIIPRINSLDTAWIEDDLTAIVGPEIWGISVGKIQSAADISTISQLIAGMEQRANVEVGSIKMIPWIETALAIVHCYEICRASQRIVAVAFGGEDFANDMAIERNDEEANVAYARSALCIAARAAGVLALDTPYFKFRDQQGLSTNTIAGKQLGFKGKFAIHPDQIDTLNACFKPSSEEIEQAHIIVATFEKAEAAGRGSTSLHGRVIDVPVVKRARAVLALADDTPG